MEILRFFPGGQMPQPLARIDAPPPDGFVWIDFQRESDAGWPVEVERISGVTIDPAHVRDAMNTEHPSFFDRSERYEMIVFRGLGGDSDLSTFTTRQTTIFLLDRVLVTVHAASSVSVGAARAKLSEPTRIPRRSVGLLHLILNTMVDRFLALREPFQAQVEEWQERLLDPKDPFDDWHPLMDAKRRLRRLEMQSEAQQDALIAWREETSVEIDRSLAVRLADLLEHIRRVQSQVEHFAADLDALVQLNFSASAHRANEIMKLLTVVAAIFLPLTLVAGIWGMNFDNMPELHTSYGYFIALGLMAFLGIGMMIAFKRRGWY